MGTTHLLDVNVLVALADPGHEFHAAATAWQHRERRLRWATSPLTENALLRILSQPCYPRSLGSPAAVLPLLLALRRARGHEFWPDDVSLAQAALFPSLAGLRGPHLTDVYLLGLAVKRKGRFVTFDARVPADSVAGGPAALVLLPTA